MTGRQERQRADHEHSVDRRRVSQASKRRIAEAIHREETAAALAELFEVVTGDTVGDHPPVRDVRGAVALGDGVALASDRSLVVVVSVGAEETRAFVNADSGGAYTARELADGRHDVAAEALEVREYDPDTLESTRYAVESAAVKLANESVTVDSAAVPIGDAVDGPSVTVDTLTVGDEITEDA